MRNLSGGRGGRAITIGVKPGTGVLNNTKSEYEIASGYSTVANSYASRIAIQPGEVAYLNSGGSPRDFARWSIGEPSEFEDVRVRPLTEILTLA